MLDLRDLPENFDPYDMDLKRKVNTKADAKNYVIARRDSVGLACGAHKNNKYCKQPAGAGTLHPGYGRCRHHGGCSTGVKTEAGKQAINDKRSVMHGMYRGVLMPYETEFFDQCANQDLGLDFEISFWKAKILGYLQKTQNKWQKAYESKLETKGHEKAMEHADKETRVYYNVVSENEDGETISRQSHFYHAATIEDKPLVKALETLSRLVDKQVKIKGLNKTDADNLLDNINKELRDASYGQVSISWGGSPQTRQEK